MRAFFEKVIILIICLYASYQAGPGTDIVLVFVLSLIVSLLVDLTEKIGYKCLFYILYFYMLGINEGFIYYLPLLLYNLYMDFGLYSLLTTPILLVNFTFLGFIASLISLYLAAANKDYYSLVEKNKSIRDSLMEDSLYLSKYNDQLKIDKEKNIHIAILTERNRIARELHDSIGHSISSSILQVEALKVLCPKDSLENLNTLQETLTNGMEDIRKSIHNLYKESLDLESRIYELAQDMADLDLILNYRIENDLNHNLAFDILSIIKESITNCAKHSNASQITINLLEQPKFYSISIKDNGSNFQPESIILSKGIGLSSMKEISSKYNGLFHTEFNRGFKIHITLMKG